jgi:predicted nucleotidyltransferase
VSVLESALGALLERLARQGASVAVVGGLAVSARTEPRFTRDADVCVAVDDDDEAESLVHSLQADGYRVLALVEQQVAARIATVRLASPRAVDEGVVLDLLFASSGIEHEVVGSADEMELFGGIRAPIATVSSLIALKVLSRDDALRPQDRVDLVALVRLASDGDLAEARRLLGLINERGFGRSRDLAAHLDALIAEST